MRSLLYPAALGAFGGAVVGLGVWAYASSALDKQLEAGGTRLSSGIAEGRSTLEARLRQGEIELQSRIRTEVSRTLNSYNLTPETGQRISRLLAAAESAGLLR